MSLAIVYDRYVAQIANLQAAAANAANSIIGLTQRQWRTPDGWAPASVFDIPSFDAPFSRADINNAFPTFFNSDSGKIADCMAAQLQSDHLAVQRRAFGMRHASRVRCSMHAAGRRAGHGNTSGGLFARLTTHVQDLIISGTV